MKNEIKKNVSTAIYVRVSTEEQAQEGFSIRGQTEKLKHYAHIKDWDIFDIYSDEGISGKNIVDRPAMNRLIDDINDGKVNNVLVFKVDRLTRSTKNLLELVELFEEKDCAFNSLTESIDTDTPSGRMFLKIIGIFAEFERENITERSRLGKERKAKEGYTIATKNISYGYERKKGERIQTIHSEESKIVREVFSMYLDKNMTMTGIAKTLNARKIPTKNDCGSWTATRIKEMLQNPNYIGKVRKNINDEENYFEADGRHKSIISDEIFCLAQDKINNIPNISRTKQPKEDNYFCGVLYCGMCNSKFTTRIARKTNKKGEEMNTRLYTCNKMIYFNEHIACRNLQITHKKMERAFVEYIQNINDPAEIEDITIDDSVKKAEQELLESIVSNEKKLQKLLERKRKVMGLFVKGELEFDEYKNMLNMSNEEQNALEIELQRKKAELPILTSTPQVLPEDIITNIKENWDRLNDNERMTFLQRFIKNISITVTKEKGKSNIVNIDKIEFHSGELQAREAVRGKIKRKNTLIR